MPTINDDFNRTCMRLDLNPEWSMVVPSKAPALDIDDADLRCFNDCVARVAPGTPALSANQIAGAARRLARAVGAGNGSRFIRTRMRRAAEVRAMLADEAWVLDPGLLVRAQDLLGYLDGPVALVPFDVPSIGGLDRALLVDLAMQGLRAELDEYVDFCRYRAGEAARLGGPPEAVDIDRERWLVERGEELRLERLCAGREARHTASSAPPLRWSASAECARTHAPLAAARRHAASGAPAGSTRG
ncbi:MAG: hypothetical protein ACREP0_00470 [Rhodanobacteraceae bacterium]